jgi:signal transduction histidine kinase
MEDLTGSSSTIADADHMDGRTEGTKEVGAAITMQAVTAHGGTVAVVNQDRGGAVITIRFPGLLGQHFA